MPVGDWSHENTPSPFWNEGDCSVLPKSVAKLVGVATLPSAPPLPPLLPPAAAPPLLSAVADLSSASALLPAAGPPFALTGESGLRNMLDGVRGSCSARLGSCSNLRLGDRAGGLRLLLLLLLLPLPPLLLLMLPPLVPRAVSCTCGGTGEKVTFRAAVADAGVGRGLALGLLGGGTSDVDADADADTADTADADDCCAGGLPLPVGLGGDRGVLRFLRPNRLAPGDRPPSSSSSDPGGPGCDASSFSWNVADAVADADADAATAGFVGLLLSRG
mmetsp:Transcript_35147/g.76215  ORF Transcript_35147/g.76215 Transcript_35147/m.76215 type:complete len:275 (-) Transcript_35147:1083-1907(-)